MSKAKRYYWLKLKEDFFEDDTIAWIEEQERGKDYVLFYLKLCLKSIKNDGRLIRTVGDMLIPYSIKKLAEITRTDLDTAMVAIQLFQKAGLVELVEGDEIYLTKLEDMVGSETQNASIQRNRRNQKVLSESKSDNVTTMSSECYDNVEKMSSQSIEYRDKSIEYRDKSIYNNISCSNSEPNNCHLFGKIEQDESLVVQTADDRIVKSSCPSMTPALSDQMFERFWQAYPRKVSKSAAQKAFTKLKVTQTLLDKMLVQIERAKQTKQWQDPQYIPHPATWLNGRRWEDELTESAINSEKEEKQDGNNFGTTQSDTENAWGRGFVR